MYFSVFFDLIKIWLRWDDNLGYWICQGCKMRFDKPSKELHSSLNCSLSKLKSWQKARAALIKANPDQYREYCESKEVKIIDSPKLDEDKLKQVPLSWYRKQIRNLGKLSINLSEPSGAEVIEALAVPLRKLTAEDLIPKICKKRIIKTGDPIMDALPMRDIPFYDFDNQIISDENLDDLEEQEKGSEEKVMQVPNFKIAVNVLDLVKSQIFEADYGYVIEAYPAKGCLYVGKNNLSYVTGYLKTKSDGSGKGGKYPCNYLKFLENVFGFENNTIEVCSNSISNTDVFTVDINPEYRPSSVDNGETLSKIESNRFDRWRCDPPYSEKAAKEMYGTPLPDAGKLLKAGARVCKPKALMFLLLGNVNRQACPSGIKRIGHVSISVIPNNESRSLHIYYKLPMGEGLDCRLPEVKVKAPYLSEQMEDNTCDDILDKSLQGEGSLDTQAAGGDVK